jgi:hypothetical protein
MEIALQKNSGNAARGVPELPGRRFARRRGDRLAPIAA